MLNNVIYLVKTKDLDSEDWWKFSLPTIESYSKRINTDLRILTDPLPYNIPNFYFMVFECLRDFEKTNYDRMLLLDLDIEISENAPNIFEECPKGFYIRKDAPYSKSTGVYKRWLKKRDVEYHEDMVKNPGVFLADREDVIKINKEIPENLTDYFRSNFIDPEDDRQFKYLSYTELPYFCYFLVKSGIKINNLDYAWNQESVGETAYFTHYTGGKKSILSNKFKNLNRRK